MKYKLAICAISTLTLAGCPILNPIAFTTTQLPFELVALNGSLSEDGAVGGRTPGEDSSSLSIWRNGVLEEVSGSVQTPIAFPVIYGPGDTFVATTRDGSPDIDTNFVVFDNQGMWSISLLAAITQPDFAVRGVDDANSLGQVCGSVQLREAADMPEEITGSMGAFAASRDGFWLLPLPEGLPHADQGYWGANALNTQGQVVGSFSLQFGFSGGDSVSWPILWTSGVPQILSTEPFISGIASDINEAGWIAGAVGNAVLSEVSIPRLISPIPGGVPAVWMNGELRTFPGPKGFSGGAIAINERGDFVAEYARWIPLGGRQFFPIIKPYLWTWNEETGQHTATDLLQASGIALELGENARIAGLNSQGQVVLRVGTATELRSSYLLTPTMAMR